MNLAIVGSQILDAKQYLTAKWIIQSVIQSHANWPQYTLKVISGGASGIDSLAKEMADKLLVDFEDFKPETRSWLGSPSKKGFKDRNLEIVAAADELVCIRNRFSQTYGSGWTADQFELIKKKLPMRLYV